jgi:hypothetical protein
MALTNRGTTCQVSEAKRSIDTVVLKCAQICSNSPFSIPQSDASGGLLSKSSATRRSLGCHKAVTLKPEATQSWKMPFKASAMFFVLERN